MFLSKSNAVLAIHHTVGQVTITTNKVDEVVWDHDCQIKVCLDGELKLYTFIGDLIEQVIKLPHCKIAA